MGVRFAGNILASSQTEPLPIEMGGTGETTAIDAINALLPSQTGQSLKYLQTDGTNVSWQEAGGSSAAGTLTGTTLASNVVNSSLTSVGNLTALRVLGNVNFGSFADGVPRPSVGMTSNNLVLSGGNNFASGFSGLAGGISLIGGNGTNAGGAIAITAGLDGSDDRANITLTGGAVNVVGILQMAGSAGTSGQVLTSNGSGSAATWQEAPGGAADTLTGTTLASNVVSSSLTSLGTLSSLAVTGTTTQTGALNLAGSSSPLRVGGSAGTSGQVLTSAGTGATPTWSAIPATAANSLTGTTLASNVVSSSLTSVGTLSGLTVSGSATVGSTSSSTSLDVRTNTNEGLYITAASGYVAGGGGAIYFRNIGTTTEPQSRIKTGYSSSGDGNRSYLSFETRTSVEDGLQEVLRLNGGGGASITGGLTVSTGNISVTSGTVTATSFSGAGSSITSLNASNISSGTVSTARLGSGTANSTTFLRGDGSWAAPTATADANTLTGTTLASNVVNSSLTSVGNLTGTMSTATSGNYVSIGTGGGGNYPGIHINNASASADAKFWQLQANRDSGYELYWRTQNDAKTSGDVFFSVFRSGATVSEVRLSGQSVNLTGLSTGLKINGATGTSGQVLTSNGSSSAPTWQDPAGGAAGTLTGTTLASNVVNSSLTSVGTLTGLTVSGATAMTGTYQARGALVTSTASSGVSLGSDSNYPGIVITASASATNQKISRIFTDRDNGAFNAVFVNDAFNASTTWLSVTRSGTTPQVATLTSNTVNLAVGTGGLQLNGSVGTSGQVLTSQGSGSAPIWTTPSGGAAGTLTGTTLASNVVSSSLTTVGTLSALAVTGTTTQTGALNLAGSSSPLQVGGSAGTSGQVLTSAGPGATPTWTNPTASTNLPRVTSISSTVVGKRVAVSTNQTITATTWAGGGSIAVGDIFSIYNDSSSAITITAGAGLTMYKDGVASSVGSVTLAARGSCTVWYNTVTEVVVNGSIV